VAPAIAAPVEVAADVSDAADASGVQMQLVDEQAPAPTAATAKQSAGIREQLDKILHGREVREANAVAENERVMQLHGTAPAFAANGDAPADHPVAEEKPPADEPIVVAAAALTSADGSRVITVEDDERVEFTLGSMAEPAKLAVWRRGPSFLVQQLGGEPASVAGLSLGVPVILDDGDEIVSGDAAMRFSLRADA
jgi:hypothetical protein